ncbi:MAG TPA: hypothetical protein PLU53_12740 [Bacteroidia bacterium]|nr:hypothetical protein [Bacteroidia bacterium]
MKKFLSTLIVLFTLHGIKAQPKLLFQDQQQLSSTIRFNPSGNAETNQVLALLAQAQGMRPGSYAEVPLIFQLRRQISRVSRSECMASVWFSEIRINRELMNKGFDIRAVLEPTSVLFEMLVPGNQLVRNNKVLQIEQGSTSDASFTFIDTGMKQITVQANQIRFLFDNSTLGLLRERLATIQNYYSADATLQQAILNLSSVRPDDFEHLDDHFSMLANVDRQIASLDAFNFPGQLDLFNTDPIHFVDRMQDLKRRADEVSIRMQEAKANLFVYHYHNGLDLLSRGRRDYARIAFRHSLRENPRFAPAAYQLAEMDYEDGYIFEAECGVSEIIREMNADPETRRMTGELAKSIYEAYLLRADQQYDANHLPESIDYLKKANHLCSSVGGVLCDSRIDRGFRKVRMAVYQSFLTDAKQNYQQGNLETAETLLAKAIAYQQDYAREVPSSGEALEMMQVVRQKKYENLVQDGRSRLLEGKFSYALKKLEEASTVQKQFGLRPVKDADELKSKAAKPLLLERISEGLVCVGKNDLAGARKASREAVAMQNQYSLQNDADVLKSMQDLKTKIYSQECVNAQQWYDGLLREIHQRMSQLDYFAAEEKIREAGKFLEGNIDCSLNEGGMSAIHDSILPAVTYQTLVNQSLDFQSQKRYQEMIDKYQQAGVYFNQFSISRFGIRHAELFDFACAKGNNSFLIFLADQYTGKQEYEAALGVFRQLLSRDYSSSFYKGELERLGIQLGKRDNVSVGGKDWKTAARKYTNGDRRMKYLEKGFKKGWKQG